MLNIVHEMSHPFWITCILSTKSWETISVPSTFQRLFNVSQLFKKVELAFDQKLRMHISILSWARLVFKMNQIGILMYNICVSKVKYHYNCSSPKKYKLTLSTPLVCFWKYVLVSDAEQYISDALLDMINCLRSKSWGCRCIFTSCWLLVQLHYSPYTLQHYCLLCNRTDQQKHIKSRLWLLYPISMIINGTHDCCTRFREQLELDASKNASCRLFQKGTQQGLSRSK